MKRKNTKKAQSQGLCAFLFNVFLKPNESENYKNNLSDIIRMLSVRDI